MRRRRATSFSSSVRRSWKSPLPPAVPSAATSEPSFAGALVLLVGAAFVAVVVVKASKGEEEEEEDNPPSCPQPCTSAGPDDCLVNSVAARPHGLIVVLRRFGAILRRHIQPIGGGGHLCGPLLRVRTAPVLHSYVPNEAVAQHEKKSDFSIFFSSSSSFPGR